MKTKLSFFRNISLGFVAIIFLYGCVSTKLTTQELHTVKKQTPPEGKAVIYIVRPSSYFGAAINFDVVCDKESIGSTMGGQFIFAFVEPGKHEIISSSENKARLFLVTEANKTYYIEQQVKMGLIIARNKLVSLSDIKGVIALNKCKLSTDCPAYKNFNIEKIDSDKQNSVKISKSNENSVRTKEIKNDSIRNSNQNIQNEKPKTETIRKSEEDVKSIINKLNNADSYYSDKNYLQAFSIFNKYCNDPNFTSEHMNTLGKMYFNGQGTLVNYNQAIACFTKAAQKGNAKSMYNLGVMYYEGKGVEQDNSEAYEWFKKSADLGNINAMNNLAEMVKNGRGINK